MVNTGKYVVAVSGGVDSVVLLHMLVKDGFPISQPPFPNPQFIVAHFDHGIRPESGDDAEFVRTLADKYGVPFETRREELGKGASEEFARNRRYAFLNEVAKKYAGKIVTAHHADDVIETIAINIVRGTGWRGLAVLGSPNIERPLLDKTKAELIEYAHKNNLEWREDSTNSDTKYLRNNLRRKLIGLDDDTKQLLRMYRERQCYIRKTVDDEASEIAGESPYSRYLFINAPRKASLELLRATLVKQAGTAPTRPQMKRALLAIKTYHGGSQYEVAEGVSLSFTKTHFVVHTKG